MAQRLVQRFRAQVVVVGDASGGVLAVLAAGVGVAGGRTVFVDGLGGELGETAGAVRGVGRTGASKCRPCGERCGYGLEGVSE